MKEMSRLFLSLLLFLFSIAGVVRTQTCLPDDSREKFASCSSCFQEAGTGCGWCLELDNQNLAKGCVPASKCSAQKFLPGKAKEQAITNTNLGPSAHIKPQKIGLELRPKVKHTLKFTAKKSENAVDIYFLLDLSGSMGLYKKQLETIPEQLVTDIKARTTDYQFGYGAFREKPMTPMSKIIPGVEYDFEHFQSLTKETDQLKKKIKNSQVSANYDTPEAGMDGLAQVLLCEKEIGWRKDSTHIIVFITDAPSHIAGDGIIGGIWKPYEHKCNLVRDTKDQSKMVYNSLDNDYPSLSEISYLLEKTQKTVIFGTPSVVLPLYKQMVTEKVIYRAAAGDIGTKGEGLRKLVTDEYNKIEGSLQVSAIRFSPSNVASQVRIKFDSTCSDKKITDTDISCKGVNVKDEIQITAEIELDTRVCENKSPFSFEIHVFGQSSSTMTVNVNPICECENCPVERNNAPCNQNGDPRATKVCGACKCVDKQGDTCQCSKEGGLELDQLIEQCEAGPGKLECSGHGSCHCGICKCNPGFIGKYCGCAKRNSNCGEGEGRGDPQCEQKKTETTGKVSCKCREGWSGDTCTCSTKQDQCKDPFTDQICNGNGKCNCNECECSSRKEGQFCQKSKGRNEDDATCDRLAPCILLDVYKNDPEVKESYKTSWKEECKEKERYSCFVVFNTTKNGTEDNLINLGDQTIDDTNEIKTTCKVEDGVDDGLKKCSVPVQFNTCYMDVRHDATKGLNDYNSNNWWKMNNLYVIYDNKKPQLLCPTKINMALLMGSAGGAGLFLFIIGFLTFCIVINMRDRKEYKRFMAEQEEVWGKGDVKGNKLHKEKSSMRQSIKNRMSRVSFKT